MAQQKQVWLKALGTAAQPLPDRWLVERPDFLSAVHFIRQPSSIRGGDILVYYAPGHKKLFAVATASEDGKQTTMHGPREEKSWPYVLHVQVKLAIPQLVFAPDYEVLDKAPGAMAQKGHIRLTDQEYSRFLDALTTSFEL
jgi:hypothetical protein